MNGSINKACFWHGDLTFTVTLAYCLVQLLQLYGVVAYPMDERLIYVTALCMVIPFVLKILAFYYITPAGKKFWSHAASTFTALSKPNQ
jgi:hypothetical protein